MGINEIRPDVIARGKNSAFEAERYELTEPPRYHFELQRREFFRVMGAGAVVLVASRALAGAAGTRRGGRRGCDAGGDAGRRRRLHSHR